MTDEPPADGARHPIRVAGHDLGEIRAIEVHGLDGELRIDGVTRRLGRPAGAEDAAQAPRAGGPRGLAARLGRLPPVRVHRARLRLSDGRQVADGRAAQMEWDPGRRRVTVDRAVARVEAGHRRAGVEWPRVEVSLAEALRVHAQGGRVWVEQPGPPPPAQPWPDVALEDVALTGAVELAEQVEMAWIGMASAAAFGGRVEVRGGGAVGALDAPRWLVVAGHDLELARVFAGLPGLDPPLVGRLDAEVAVVDPRSPMPQVAASLSLRDGIVSHPGVAATPVDDISGELFALGALDGERWHVDWQGRRGALTVNGRVDGVGLDRDAGLRVSAAVEPVACTAALAAIPAALLGPYAGVRAEGAFVGRLSLDLPLHHPRALVLRGHDIEGACPITALRPDAPRLRRGAVDRLDVEWLAEDFVHPVPGLAGEEQVGPGDPSWVPLERLPPYVPAVMYLSEDLDLFTRGGALDMHLIARALKLNLQRGRYVYGGSTVPQQLVKNLFLTREKTLARKVRELVIASRMVDRIPPERILALYVNCIEFAPGVYGLRRAARHYFGIEPEALTPQQAVFLATAKPSPRYAETLRRRGATPDTPHYRRYVQRLFDRLVAAGALSRAEVEALGELRVEWRRGGGGASAGEGPAGDLPAGDLPADDGPADHVPEAP